MKKQKRPFRILATLFLAILPAAAVHAVELSMADNGRQLPLTVGEKLIIRLPGNPTTGYGWFVQTCDSTFLHQPDDPAYTSDSNLLGAGGQYTFTFDTTAPGKTTLTLVYHRPWKKDKPPEKTFSIHLDIQPAE